MRDIYLSSLLIIIVVSYMVFVKYPRFVSREGFDILMCKADSDCPKRFKCNSGKCVDTRPKGN